MTDFATTPRGDRVAFDATGPADGHAVIFVAGAGPSRADDPITGPTAQLLAERGVHAIVFDRLGRNESAADGSLDLDRELEAIAALIDEAGGRAVLVGHSSGCSISLAAAVRGLPVSGLVLWEAPIQPNGSGQAEWAAGFEALLDEGRLEEARKHYMRDMPPEWLAGAMASPAWPHIVESTPSLRADAESLRWADETPHGELFSGIDVPVAVVVGSTTEPILDACAAGLAATIPGARRATVAGAHHAWEPPAMAEFIGAFLDGVGARAAEGH